MAEKGSKGRTTVAGNPGTGYLAQNSQYGHPKHYRPTQHGFVSHTYTWMYSRQIFYHLAGNTFSGSAACLLRINRLRPLPQVLSFLLQLFFLNE
jgi:hypothetical protein